ncbi:hypothetical protein FOA52_001501 [Chlamydomonas sp. UWO 241]|nr:hypothetical protein FOA52_001501 [Chlamydomonas sp. UWO 241]
MDARWRMGMGMDMETDDGLPLKAMLVQQLREQYQASMRGSAVPGQDSTLLYGEPSFAESAVSASTTSTVQYTPEALRQRARYAQQQYEDQEHFNGQQQEYGQQQQYGQHQLYGQQQQYGQHQYGQHQYGQQQYGQQQYQADASGSSSGQATSRWRTSASTTSIVDGDDDGWPDSRGEAEVGWSAPAGGGAAAYGGVTGAAEQRAPQGGARGSGGGDRGAKGGGGTARRQARAVHVGGVTDDVRARLPRYVAPAPPTSSKQQQQQQQPQTGGASTRAGAAGGVGASEPAAAAAAAAAPAGAGAGGAARTAGGPLASATGEDQLLRPRVPGASFAPPTYGSQKNRDRTHPELQDPDHTHEGHHHHGHNSHGTCVRCALAAATATIERIQAGGQLDAEDRPRTEPLAAIAATLPAPRAAAFGTSARWGGGRADSGASVASGFGGGSGGNGQAQPASLAEKMAADKAAAIDLEVAYRSMLPRAVTAAFSKSKRWQEEADDDWRRTKAFRPTLPGLPGSKQDGAEPVLDTVVQADQNQALRAAHRTAALKTPGVEAALALTKLRTTGGAVFGAPSVREEMRMELERRRAARAAGAVAAAVVEAAAAAGLASAGAAQRRSPERTGPRPAAAQQHASNESPPLRARASSANGDGTRAARPGDPGAPPPPLPEPSWSLIERTAPAVRFGSMHRSVSALPERTISREPGPGTYMPGADADSRARRAPSPAFPSASRDEGFGAYAQVFGWMPGALSLSRWRESDAPAALDRTKRRAPVPAIPLEARVPPSSSAGSHTAAAGGDVGDAGDKGGDSDVPMLDMQWQLVEPRVRGGAMARAPLPTLTEAAERVGDEDALMDLDAGWGLVRASHPAWGFAGAPRWRNADADDIETARHGPLHPNWDAVSTKRAVVGIPLFAAWLNAVAAAAGARARRLAGGGAGWHAPPAVGEYDTERAWAVLRAHVPVAAFAAAAARWRVPHPRIALEAGGDQAVLELSHAVALLRPRPPAWGFVPLPTVVTRVRPGLGSLARGGGGCELRLEMALTLVKRRAPAAPSFAQMLGRMLAPVGAQAAETQGNPRLAPGAYDIERALALIEGRAGGGVRFHKHLPRGLLPGSDPDSDGEAEGREQPREGGVLELDVEAAKDRTMRRTGRFVLRMLRMLGRGDGLGLGPLPPGAATAHLPLADPDIGEAVTARRVRQVVLTGPGHAPPISSPDADDAKRGPGFYGIGAEPGMEITGPAWDFARRRGRPQPASPDWQGDKLKLSPRLSAVRKSAHAVLIPREHAPPRPGTPELYPDAAYAYDLSLIRPSAPPVPDIGAGLPRGARIPGAPLPSYTKTGGLDYDVADIPLTVLAGHCAAPRAPDFSTLRPHVLPGPAKPSADGQRLSLSPSAADGLVFRAPQRVPDLSRARADPPANTDDAAEFRGPSMHFLSPQPARARGAGAPRSFARMLPPRPLGREAETGDLDAGVYAPDWARVMRSAPAVDFASAAERELLPTRRDPDLGNVLLLQPRHAGGWSPKVERTRTEQPFGRRTVRWADDPDNGGPDATDDGQVLFLRPYAADDLAMLGKRPTAPSARNPTPWASMRAPRDAYVLQPHPDAPPLLGQVRSSAPTRSTYTALLGHATTRDTVLQRLQAHVPGGPDDTAIAAFRRRDRVWKRLLPALDVQQVSAVEAEYVAHPRPFPQQASSAGQPWRGGRLTEQAEDVAAAAAADKAAAHRSEQAWAAGHRAGPRTRGTAVVVGSASLVAMRVIAQTAALPVPVGKLKPRDREMLRRLAEEARPKLPSTPYSYSPPKPPVFGPDPRPPPPPPHEPYNKSPPPRLVVALPGLQLRAPESRTFR